LQKRPIIQRSLLIVATPYLMQLLPPLLLCVLPHPIFYCHPTLAHLPLRTGHILEAPLSLSSLTLSPSLSHSFALSLSLSISLSFSFSLSLPLALYPSLSLSLSYYACTPTADYWAHFRTPYRSLDTKIHFWMTPPPLSPPPLPSPPPPSLVASPSLLPPHLFSFSSRQRPPPPAAPPCP